MADFPTSARVVIIGGGAVGASSLYHLCKAGWTDCVLLEKNELTAGSTWHAAGNVPTFSSSWSIMNMQRYSASLYRGLGAEVDYPMNYHVTGSVRLGHSRERLQEFQRVVGMGRYQGMDLNILTPFSAPRKASSSTPCPAFWPTGSRPRPPPPTQPAPSCTTSSATLQPPA